MHRYCFVVLAIPVFVVPASIAHGQATEEQAPAVVRKELPRLSGIPDITTLAFSPDGKLLAVGYESFGPVVIELETGKLRWWGDAGVCCNGSMEYVAVTFRPDGKQLFVAASTVGLYAFDTTSGEQLHPETRPGSSVAFGELLGMSADGRYLVNADRFEPEKIELVDTSDWRRIFRIAPRAEDSPTSAGFAEKDQQVLISYGSGKLDIHNTTDGERIQEYDLGPDGEFAAFSPDGTLAVTTSKELWNVPECRKLGNLYRKSDLAADGFVNGDALPLQFTPKQQRLLIFIDNEKANVLELPSRTIVRQFEFAFADHPNAATISPDGKRIAVGGRNHKTISIWDVATGKKVQTIEPPLRKQP